MATLRSVVFIAACAGIPVPAQPAKVSFERDVFPILQAKCHSCHGEQKQLSGLRLDLRQNALRGGDYGKVIEPGNAEASKLIARVEGSKQGLQMPPEGPLEPHEVAMLRAWIDQGADFGVSVRAARANAARSGDSAEFKALANAIVADDITALRRMLKLNPAVVRAADTGGSTALMHAAGRGSLAAMKVLLDAEANPLAANRRGATALEWALASDDKVALLLSRGVPVNRRTSEGRTPLHIAATQTGSAAILGRLIRAGAEVNARDLAGMTPLHAAAASGSVENVRVLLAAGANAKAVNPAGMTPLIQAAISGSMECVRLLIAAGADPKAVTRKNISALAAVSYWGDVETMKLLIEKGAAVQIHDADGYSPLMFAAYSEYASPDAIRLLLASGADPKSGGQGHTPLSLAAYRGDTPVLRLLREVVKD